MGIGTRLRGAAGIRDDEAATVLLIAAVFATLEAGRGLGEVGVTTLVLSRLGVEALPWLFIALGLVSLVVAVSFGGALGRMPRARLFGVTLVGIGVLLGVEWLALRGMPDAVPLAWLTVYAAGAIAVTIGWTVAGSTLDARQARRLFPICTAAAIAGNFMGSLAAGQVARAVGTEGLVLAEGLLFGLAAVLIGRVAARAGGRGWTPVPADGRSIIDDVRVGFDDVRQSSLMRLVALAYVLFAVLMFSVSFPFQRAASEAFPTEADLADTLGALAAVMAGASFFVSLVIANRFYARFGIAAAALVLPIVYLAGFGLWLVQFTFATAAVVLVVQQVAQRGLSNAAWSAFYNVVPSGRRAQVMAFNDGVPGQLGIMLSGILLLTAGRFLAPEQVFWLGLATAAVCTAVVIAIRRRYADALLRTLRSGLGEQVLEGGPGLGDLVETPDVRAALIAALASPEAGTRGMAATLLARSDAPEARTALVAILDDPDPVVRGAAARSILGGAQSDGGDPDTLREHAEACLTGLLDGDEAARVVGLGTTARLGRMLPPDRRAAALADPAVTVRAMAVAGLADAPDDAATTIMIDALRDEGLIVRRAAATALSTRPAVDARQLALLAGGSLDVQEAAIASLEGHGAEVHDDVLGWADRHVDRAVELATARHALVSSSEPSSAAAPALDADGSTAFLLDVLDRRVARHQGLALAAMAVLGAPAARGVIRRCLRSGDPEVRAQAIEALDSIGDRRLGAAIARLVELAPAAGVASRDATLDRLRHDVDPWIRALARRAAPNGDEMPEVERSLGDVETMLRLRRVPLLAALAPEDLQRIAMVAGERSFAPGEALVREGDLGDELFVILEGRVRVVHADPDGTEHLLRTYEEGDHIGELAVLRERPRAATVIADGVTVRTLVIGGEGLTAILRERPDAAMAMLATLAERISAQR